MELRCIKKPAGLVARAAAFALVAAVALCVFAPKAALAAEYVATVQDVKTGKTLGSYTSSGDAVNAAYGDDKVLVMLKDWNLSTTQGIHGGKSVTIDMNSHRITGSGSSSVFHLYEGAKLTLRSNKGGTVFTFNGVRGLGGGMEHAGLKSGGLVTGGKNVFGGGIYMEDRAHLILDNVAVAGNICENTTFHNSYGGGVYMKDDCTVDIQNGAVIEYNYSPVYGGGVSVDGKNCTVNIDSSAEISDNFAKRGGGLYSSSSKTHVKLTNGGRVCGNGAVNNGGGMYFNETDFCVESDGTGTFWGNLTEYKDYMRDEKLGGAAIYVNAKTVGDNSGEIKGVAFEYNYANRYAGAVMLRQEQTKVTDCTFKNNASDLDGGAIYIDNDDNVISGCTFDGNYAKEDGGAIYVNDSGSTIADCTLKGNRCGDEGGGVYVDDNVTVDNTTITGNWCASEGGGLFVGYKHDVEMTGVCVVKGNTRGKDSGVKDDVFLNHLSGGGGKAYITGSLASGSSVGVRTGYEDERRIAKSFKPETNDCLFIDLDGYYVSYGTDEGGDAWQRHTTKEFELTVNGKSIGRFKNGTTVTANGTSTDVNKVFKCWNSDGTTGLNPFSDYIGDSDLKNPVVSFKMPQNDVSLAAEYVTRTKNVSLTLATPRDGSVLSTEGTLLWTSADDGVLHSETVAVSWYKQGADGTLELVTGKAEADAVYVARVSLAQDADAGRAFALDIQGSDVKVTWTGVDGSTERTASSASVDASGTLSITSDGYTAGGATFTGVEPISLTFAAGTSREDFDRALPAKATALKSNGNTQQFEIDWSQIDFNGWFGDSGLKPHMSNVTFFPGLKDPNGILGRGVTVSISFTFTETAETVAVPTVKPAAGTYKVSEDSDSFDDDKTKMMLTATCATDDAEIKYTLSRSDGSRWTAVAKEADYASGIDIAVVKGATASYRLEIWAVKGKATSQHNVLYYTIEDDRKAETVDVTVKYTDTGMTPAAKDDDTYSVEKGQDAVLIAPARTGYTFEKWVDADSGKGLGTEATLKLESVERATTVTAVYNPAVTAIDIEMDAPVAHQFLSQAASSVKATAAGREVDLTSYLSSSSMGQAKISWAPEGDDEGKADHMTAYTASLEFKDSSATTGVKYVLADSVTIKCGGRELSGGSAYIKETDGTRSICIAFPSTGAYEEPSVAELGTVKMFFADAWASWKKAGGDQAVWASGLPDQVEVDYKCGESELYDITWDSIEAFAENATKEQTLTAKGTITWPDYVDSDNVSDEVTVKIEVAAPKTVGTPTASVKNGTHKGTQQVELSCGTEGATIRYTTDDSEPTEENGQVYDGEPIEVAHNAKIKAKAFCDAMRASGTATFTYTIKHEVKFDSDGGSSVESQWVVDGEKANKPADPTYKDYDFAGWTLDDEPYDFGTPVTSDLTLYARWSKDGDDTIAHLVIFDANGGSKVAAQTVSDGDLATEPAAPTRSGYEFTGWTLDGKTYDFSTPVTGDLTLVATWKKQESKKDDTDKGDGKKDDDKSDTDEGDEQKVDGAKTVAKVTTETKSSSALAATGDRTFLIVGALVALGVVAATAGIISKRKKK